MIQQELRAFLDEVDEKDKKIADLEWQIAELRENYTKLQNLYEEARGRINELLNPPEREKQIERIIAYSEYAEKLRIPYKFGAEWINDKAFDCSSFMLNIFKHGANITLKRGAGDQSKQGKEVKYEDLQRGDLVFFDVNGGTPNAGHVGIYLGDGTFRHTNVPSAGIHVNKMSDWKKRFITARRIL